MSGGTPEERPAPQEAGGGLEGHSGAIVAGRDVIGSSTQYVRAGQAFVLPPEAYAPIPSDAAQGGVSNIRSGLFVGRDEELRLLDEAFERADEVVVHAVHGLGGIGKSALAAHWAARRGELLRWRVTADTVAGMKIGLAELARALQPGLVGLPEELLAERAVRWLADHGGWLLLLDNVDDPAHIAPLLERIPGGRILITTRRASGWHHHATTIRLGVLEAGDSVDLFVQVLTHDGQRETEGAGAVCEEVGHLALAVEQAAAYCAQTGTAPDAYLEMLARWPAVMFAAGAENTDSERTVARIWRLTLDRIADTPLVGEILRILAWYAPDNIPRDLFDDLATPPEVTHAIGRLLAYNMITDNGDGTLSVHRLVQTVARTSDPQDPHRQPQDIDHARDQAATLIADAFPCDHELPETWPHCQVLLPHVDALTSRHSPEYDTIRTALVLDRAATFRSKQGASAIAIPALHRSLATRERLLGNDHPTTLASRNNLATAYEAAGDYGRAIDLFERTLHNREEILGSEDPATLASRNNLANAYELAGDYGRAIDLHERTLHDSEHLFGDDHPDTLISRNNLAVAYQAAGDFGRAIDLYERTLQGRERLLGDDHPDTLISRHNLADAYRMAGDPGRAIDLHERTLHDCERLLGDDHPQTLASRNNLANAYTSVGDFGRAIALHERTLQDRERLLGDDHPQTLASRNNLAGAYHSAGDLERAIDLYERALQDRERLLGDGHPDTLISRHNLADAYRMAGDLDRAIALFERVLHDRERFLRDDDLQMLASRHNLASAYHSAGDLGRAIDLYERTLQGRERILGNDHPHTLASRNNLATVYRMAGDLDRAINLLECTLTTSERLLGNDHPHTLAFRNNLAKACESAGDLDRAIDLYERALEGCEQALGPTHPLTATVRSGLQRVRSAQGS